LCGRESRLGKIIIILPSLELELASHEGICDSISRREARDRTSEHLIQRLTEQFSYQRWLWRRLTAEKSNWVEKSKF